MKGKVHTIVERMEDTCSPGKNKSLHTFRIYSIIIPVSIAIVFLESIFVLSSIPGTLGSALTIKGSLPYLPESVKKL
jgi:hypothetical protein